MAKGNNTGKVKRSHSYKPYDASNSSLVKRLTTKVSEILPSPSWISRWLPSSSQVDAGNDEDEEDDEEEVRHQPPLKRIRLQPSTLHNDYTHHNHVKRLSESPEKAEDLSPISRVDHRDGAVAGPSGLQIRRNNFISSTPATTQTISLVNKVNQGDDGSDSGESTSGCSSLVPQAERSPTNLSLPKITTDTQKTFSPGAVRRLSTSKDKFSKLNLSASSSSRPTFDSYVFHNPHNKSMNSSRSSQLDDSSPFYRGRTMFGGASANRDSLNSSILSSASRPRITNVKPISRQVPERDTIGSSALRILRALEQISTPVTEARKMPVNEVPRRRKAIQPYDELIIPQMPAILRIKRKKRNESELSTSLNLESKDTSDSTTLVNLSGSGEPTASTSTSTSTAALVHSNNESGGKQPLPSYSLRKEESEKDEKFVTSIKGRTNEVLENERLPEVNLPNVKLDITSLPVFSLPAANKIVPQKRVSQPDSTVQRNITKSSAPPSSTETSSSIPTSTLLPTTARPSSKEQFKFSEPIVENTGGRRITSVKASFKFSNPLEADSLHKENQFKNINKISKDNGGQSSLKETANKTILEMSSGNPNPKLKRKPCYEEKSNVLGTKLPSNTMMGSSIVDAFKTNPGINGKNKFTLISSSSDSNKDTNVLNSKTIAAAKDAAKSNIVESSKSTESIKNKWSCNNCSVENNNSDRNCTKCGVVKVNKDHSISVSSSKDKQELSSAELIVCKTCSSSYKASESKCPSCTATVKPSDTTASSTNVSSSTSAVVPLSALFKKSAGSWDCSECFVTNKGDVDACVSCSTPKPGAVPKANAQPTFQFGIPPSTVNAAPASGFKFGIDHAASDSNKTNSTSKTDFVGFNFGTNTSTTNTTPATTSTSVQGFKFGSLTSTSKAPETKITFSFGKPAEDSSKKEDKDIVDTKSVKPSFTFGSSAESVKVNEKKEESKNQDSAPAKRVTFSQQLVEEKTITTDSITNPPSSFTFVSSTKSDTQSSNTFSFSKSPPLFANVNTPSSTTETDKPPVSTSVFKFCSSFRGITSVASSTSATTASDSAVSVSSSLVTSSNNDKTSATFSFLPNNAPKVLFSSAADSEKKDTAIFGTASSKSSSFTNNLVPSSSGFTFGNRSNESDTIGEKDKSKDPPTNSFFGEKRETSAPSIIIEQAKDEDKPNFFATSSTKTDNKQLFFAPANTNKNTTSGGIFGSAKTEDWKAKSTFGSESFESKSSATSSSNVPPFCSSSTLMTNSTERKNEPFIFNAASSNQANSNVTPFIFKAVESNDNKNSGGFTFHASNNNQQMPNTNLFGASTQQQQQQQPATNLFASSSTSLFNAAPAPQPNNAAAPSFTFGAQSQPTQGIFGFSAPSQVQSGGTGIMGETYQFGSQNALPQNTATPTVATTFDPNVKPNFNFSGGATPTFSAHSSGLTSGTPAPPKDRKIRKAVRRTLR